MSGTASAEATVASGKWNSNANWGLDGAGNLTISGTGSLSSYPYDVYTAL